jgi:hypothetical protein
MSAVLHSTLRDDGPFDPAIHLAPLPDKNSIAKVMMSDCGFPDSPLTKVRAYPVVTYIYTSD